MMMMMKICIVKKEQMGVMVIVLKLNFPSEYTISLNHGEKVNIVI